MEEQIGLKVAYGSEWRTYPQYKKEISCDNVQFITDKITRHFKLQDIYVAVAGYRISRAYKFGHRIRLCSLNFGTLCHEINHFLCWKQQDRKGLDEIRHGTKKWNRNLQRLLNYCEKHNYWQEELARRNAPKPIKPEPSKNDLRKQRVILLENRIKKWNSKIKFCSNKIKKANKSIVRLNKIIEQENESK
jgi:hypothetical protein